MGRNDDWEALGKSCSNTVADKVEVVAQLEQKSLPFLAVLNLSSSALIFVADMIYGGTHNSLLLYSSPDAIPVYLVLILYELFLPMNRTSNRRVSKTRV